MAEETSAPRERDDEMSSLKKIMDLLRGLGDGRARRRVMRYVNERLEDEEKVALGLPPDNAK